MLTFATVVVNFSLEEALETRLLDSACLSSCFTVTATATAYNVGWLAGTPLLLVPYQRAESTRSLNYEDHVEIVLMPGKLITTSL